MEINCVGFSSKDLSKEQKDAINRIFASQKDKGLVGMEIFKNFHVQNDIPTGLRLHYKSSAKIDASVLPDNLFERVAAVKVLNAPVTTDQNVLLSVAPQDPPVKLRLTEDVRHPRKNTDTRHWVNELGGIGSFVGLFNHIDPLDPRKTEHVLLARSAPVQYTKDLKSKIRKNPNMTYNDLFNDSLQLTAGENFAERNINRNLLQAAQALGTSIPFVSDVHSSAPVRVELAVPDWSVSTCSLVRNTMNDTVTLNYGVIPAQSVQSEAFIIGSPYDGVYVFPLKLRQNTREAGGVPVDTGMAKTQAPPMISQCIVSENAVAQHMSAPIDNDFKEAMKQYGWKAEDTMTRMLPVAVKVWSTSPQSK
jgi:hypothetical protein